MLSPERMALASAALRDQALALIAQHEREAHHGEPCMGNRASLIAYLAHCLGVRGDAWSYAETLLHEHDARCRDRNCKHDPAEDATDRDEA